MKLEDYYRSESWKAKREERLCIDKYQCRLCGGGGSEFRLEVHHKPESYKRIPNESVEDDLTTVCSRCHDIVTNIIREERYGKQVFAVELHNSTIQERDRHEQRSWPGYEKLSVDFIVPSNITQRPIGKPTEQMGERDQEDFKQAKEDRSRP